MAQTSSFTLNNVAGAAFRTLLNTIIQALGTLNSGAAPTVTLPFMPWMDTSVTPPVLRIRNAANTAWVDYDMRRAGLGVEGVLTVTSMNTHTLSGNYRTAANAAGNPLTGEAFRFLHVSGADNTAATQDATGETSGRKFNRTRVAGTWGGWQEEWDAVLTGRVVGDLPIWTANGPGVLAPGADGTFLGRQGGVVGYFIGEAPWLYQSTQQTITNASLLTVNHGLGRVPIDVRLTAVCVTAQAPFIVGAEVEVPLFVDASVGGAAGAGMSMSDVAVNIRTAPAGIWVQNNAGALIQLANSSWRYIVRAR